MFDINEQIENHLEMLPDDHLTLNEGDMIRLANDTVIEQSDGEIFLHISSNTSYDDSDVECELIEEED